VIAAWRRTIVAAGGITACTQPLLRRLTPGVRLERKPRSRNHKDDAGAANLHSLLAAYGAIDARRELPLPGIRQMTGYGALHNWRDAVQFPESKDKLPYRSQPQHG
jgi:hypothetical protein